MSGQWEDLQALTKEVSRFKSSNPLLGGPDLNPTDPRSPFYR